MWSDDELEACCVMAESRRLKREERARNRELNILSLRSSRPAQSKGPNFRPTCKSNHW